MLRSIHVLYIQSEGSWYAQCVDVDIGAQGKTREAAEHAFFETWRMQAKLDLERGREPFEGLGPAPERFVAMMKEVADWGCKEIGSSPDVSAAEDDDALPTIPVWAGDVMRARDSIPATPVSG